jgi:hypothetical protein
MIKAYFDLGCGDGLITAGIGAYLGLSKENILGGDVFEGQVKEITFVKVDEKQSNITLRQYILYFFFHIFRFDSLFSSQSCGSHYLFCHISSHVSG